MEQYIIDFEHHTCLAIERSPPIDQDSNHRQTKKSPCWELDSKTIINSRRGGVSVRTSSKVNITKRGIDLNGVTALIILHLTDRLESVFRLRGQHNIPSPGY